MNTAAIALPAHARLHLYRLRGLYNGFGYILVLSQLQNLWWTSQAALPELLAGHTGAFVRDFFTIGWGTLLAMIPGPLLVPVVVNLAPRSGLIRIACFLGLSFIMSWWCLALVEGVHFGWNVPSLGAALDGLLTTGLIIGVCAYHSESQEAADTMLDAQIRRARLDAEVMQARLRLLSAQIEPHFLFNTLSAVRSLARSDRAATVTMLDHLIRYFDAALPRLRQRDVPLSQELELVEAYLGIYRARMGHRLNYEIALDDGLEGTRVPPMVLLTLVENALKHGIGPMVEGGFIRISGRCQDHRLVLKVADSGRGLDARHGHGTGLANVRERLLMLYGPDAVLTLRPAEPRGMVASISMPVPA